MLEDEAAVLAGGGKILLSGECPYLSQSHLPVGLGFGLVLCKGREFDEGRGHNGSSRGIPEFFGDLGGIEVPVGDSVAGETGQKHVSHVLCLSEVTLVTCLAVHHRVSVESPGLSARPRRIVAVALVGLLLDNIAVAAVICDNVPGSVVVAEVVLHCNVGVRAGNGIELGLVK